MTEIIADISGNHGGDLDKAKDLIRAAADCGCDYAKFQYYHPERMPDQENRELYHQLYIPIYWLDDLFNCAEGRRIPLFASVFDADSVKDLERYEPPFFKIASPESTRLNDYKALVGEIRQKFPIIFSCGKMDFMAISSLARGCDLLLYCHPGHPAPRFGIEEIIEDAYDFRYRYDGLSDHCANLDNAEAFIGMGKEWIERHIKLDNDCIDAAFSSNPKEMAELCKIAHE